jgi:hypothetical protein
VNKTFQDEVEKHEDQLVHEYYREFHKRNLSERQAFADFSVSNLTLLVTSANCRMGRADDDLISVTFCCNLLRVTGATLVTKSIALLPQQLPVYIVALY